MLGAAGDPAVSRQSPIEEELSFQRDLLFRDGIILWDGKVQIQSQRNHQQCNQEAEHPYMLDMLAIGSRRTFRVRVADVLKPNERRKRWTYFMSDNTLSSATRWAPCLISPTTSLEPSPLRSKPVNGLDSRTNEADAPPSAGICMIPQWSNPPA